MMVDMGISLRIPHFVVDSVQNTPELLLVHVQNVPQSVALIRVPHLPSVLGRNRGDKVRVNNGPFREVDSTGVEVVA